MIVGHYAAALIPRSRLRQYPFWLLLLCANIPEFLWLLLALLGIEPASPPSIFDATFKNLKVAMTFSHNLIPGVIQGVVVAALVFAWFRSKPLAYWCGFLTIFHVLSDLVVGFEHQLLAPDSMPVSLNTYGTLPYVAFAIEIAFSVGCIAWYQYQESKQGRGLSTPRLVSLYAVFLIGIAIWVPTTSVSLGQWMQRI
jgi:hypothetical protein